jgi:hypothetical protein
MDPTAVPRNVDLAPDSFSAAPSPTYTGTTPTPLPVPATL